MEKVDPPWVKRPNVLLRFELEGGGGGNYQKPSSSISSATSLSSANSISSNTNILTRERELDEETGKRILKLIYKRRKERESSEGGTPVKNNTNTNNTYQKTPSYTPSGHSETFFIPSNDKASSKGFGGGGGPGIGDMFDSVTDYFGVKTKSNVQRIDKAMLMDEGITIAMLITECRVPLSEMKLAKILNTFRDLMDLGFVPEDLTRNRELFNCNSLVTLYGKEERESPCKLLARNGVQFDIRHIFQGKFLPSDLMSMGYNLDEPIKNQEITSSQLRSLNYSLEDLVVLGLEREHLIHLGITGKEALGKKVNGGFEWSREYYLSLLGHSQKI